MAERILVSRPTLRRLETGNLNVSVAVLVRVLEVLGLDGDLDRVAEHDDVGQRIADASIPAPRRRNAHSLADEL